MRHLTITLQQDWKQAFARDPKRVLDDVRMLIQLGIIEKNEDDKIICPFADIHVDMHLAAAA